jgi:hypothetical protein
MKVAKQIFYTVLILMLVGDYVDRKVQAQGPAAATISGGGPHTTCTTPVAGAYFLCPASDGIWVSNNGAPYFQIVAPASFSGITSISVNGGAPQPGPTVALTIPVNPVMTVNGVAPSSSGALSLAYSQLNALPSTIDCTAVGCVIK